jgi:antibiotic biosynthesis monooxygenase (ABM) superfamily enzyme
VIEGEPKVEVRSNLELWFTPRGTNGSRRAAPTHTHTHTLQDGDSDDRRHIISILLTTLISAVQQVTEGQLPFLSRMLLVVAIMLLLMTHVLMPSIIRVLRPWLSKKTLF